MGKGAAFCKGASFFNLGSASLCSEIGEQNQLGDASAGSAGPSKCHQSSHSCQHNVTSNCSSSISRQSFSEQEFEDQCTRLR